MFLLSLLGQANPPARSPFQREEILFGTIGIAIALLVGALVVYYVDRWRKRGAQSSSHDSVQELTSFRAMYERGEITEAEYARLRQKAVERARPAVSEPDQSGGSAPSAGPPSPNGSPPSSEGNPPA